MLWWVTKFVRLVVLWSHVSLVQKRSEKGLQRVALWRRKAHREIDAQFGLKRKFKTPAFWESKERECAREKKENGKRRLPKCYARLYKLTKMIINLMNGQILD